MSRFRVHHGLVMDLSLPRRAMISSCRTIEMSGAAHQPSKIFVRVPVRPLPTRVELLGEIRDFRTPIACSPVSMDDEGALFSAEIPPLGHGVYAYKLRVDGEWMLDAHNPRTRSVGGSVGGVDGYRNNALVVVGAPEPLLFAPAPPFVYEDDGGLVVTAALRKGHGQALTLFWAEPGHEPERAACMTLADEEGEHLIFRAVLPVSTARARLGFALASGERVPGHFAYDRPREIEPLPEWWRRALVYTVFVDRFRPRHEGLSWGVDPGPNQPSGGHLDGITAALGEIAALGVSVLYLTPVHVAASCHRYDVVDPARVDPALGGEAAFARLVEAAHALGLRVLVDLSFSHAGRGFPPYEDVIERGRASRYAGFFQWAGEALVHYGTRSDAPLFNLDHPDVRALALATVEQWARRGVDGLRLDAAAEVPLDLARDLRRRFLAEKPDGLVLGEVVPAHAWRFRTSGAVDVATDFGFHAVMVDFVAKAAIDADLAARRLCSIELARGAPAAAALRFLSTHDHPRFATLADQAGERARERARLGLLALFTAAGVPALLYGEELGLSASVPVLEPENVWPDRMPMPRAPSAAQAETRALTRALAALRARSPALTRGSYDIFFAEAGLMVIRRAAEGEVVDVVLNVGEAVEIDLEDDELAALEALAVVGEARIQGSSVALGAASGLVARRARDGAQETRRRLAVTGNARARDADLVLASAEAQGRPTRLDFALTERCNLRCAHCITHAPERTQSRTARTLSPFLLDRLRDDLAFVAYAGFVHGGEALTAPIFFDLLAALRAARGSQPTMVHLLTNGVLLGERTAARLIDAGVRSISVSLDGATGSTNDSIRVGGRFDLIVDNLAATSRLRRSTGADLRLGVSVVVLRQNVGELVSLVELCARLGLDWIKFEEAAAVNEFAATSLLRLEAGKGRDAVNEAIARAHALGLVAVEHTLPDRVVWRCRLEEDPEAAAFLRADEFANRSEIHPCRGPWEIACVEPNGDIRIGDFFGPILGNVSEAKLAALWNGPAARAARDKERARRLCQQGPATCVAPAGPIRNVERHFDALRSKTRDESGT